MKPDLQRADPDEETLNWRAVCGKTARTVRREGRTSVLPYPYRHSTLTAIGVGISHRLTPPSEPYVRFSRIRLSS